MTLRFAFLALLLASGAVSAQPSAFAIVNVAVVDVEQGVVREGQTVVVHDGVIQRVGDVAAVVVDGESVRIDGTGRFLMPGLADMHAHLTVNPGPEGGSPVFHEDDEQTLRLFVAHGVTTIRNMWGSPAALRLRDRVARGEVVGPRIVTAGPIVDQRAFTQRGTPWHPTEQAARPSFVRIDTPGDAREAVRYHVGAGYDMIKVYNGLSAEAYGALADEAAFFGLPIVGHIPDKVGLLGVLSRAGPSHASIEHAASFVDVARDPGVALPDDFLAADLARWGAADTSRIALLAEMTAARGVAVTPTLLLAATRYAPRAGRSALASRVESARTTRTQLAGWRNGADQHAEVLDERGIDSADVLDFSLQLTAALQRAGATILLGTDVPATIAQQGSAVHDELELMVRAGLTPLEALRAATTAPHEWMRAWELSSDRGAVAEGETADFVLLAANPLDTIENVRRIEGVALRGQWLDRRALDQLLDTR